jgi:hypothetical protein
VAETYNSGRFAQVTCPHAPLGKPVAERVRFELTSPVKGLRFSRPVQSTALPPLRGNQISRLATFYQAAEALSGPDVSILFPLCAMRRAKASPAPCRSFASAFVWKGPSGTSMRRLPFWSRKSATYRLRYCLTIALRPPLLVFGGSHVASFLACSGCSNVFLNPAQWTSTLRFLRMSKPRPT